MADDIRINSNGPDRLEVNVKDRAVKLATQQLPFVIVLALVGALGMYRIKTHDATLQATNAHLQALYVRQDQHRDAMQTLLLAEFAQQREQVRALSALVHSEGEQLRAALRENRELTGSRMQKQDDLLAAQTEEVRKQHAIIIWNMAHEPSQHLSLDLPLPTERHPERGR